MFNGIIKNCGKVTKLISRKKGLDIYIKSNLKFLKKNIGSSVACDGVCLTLVDYKKDISRYYISNETLIRSKFKNANVNNIINLEKPMKYGDSISGHFVQGHVDTIGIIQKINVIDKSWNIEILLKKNFSKYLVEKASITINGVSLTISKIKKNIFGICVIPHSLMLTNLIYLKKNDLVNIEIDILSKYIKKFSNEKK